MLSSSRYSISGEGLRLDTKTAKRPTLSRTMFLWKVAFTSSSRRLNFIGEDENMKKVCLIRNVLGAIPLWAAVGSDAVKRMKRLVASLLVAGCCFAQAPTWT